MRTIEFLTAVIATVAIATGPASAAGAATSPDALRTEAERTQFRSTGRYAEVERLCAEYARAWPDVVRCTEFGRTPEGRPMLALAASRATAPTPEAARERDVPVLLAQGGIHAGEVDGKDAGFMALRTLLTQKKGALDSIVLVFVPVFNVDGHERFGRWNRPNQNGPEEMGWRTTAMNLNLNRDYAKADAPEMQALLRLLGAWDPILYVDLHATDGAQFEHDVANLLEPIHVGDPDLQPTGRRILAELNAHLAQLGSLPLDFYPSLEEEDDPASGFSVSPYPPRYSTGYWPLRNRFALLVETHSWKDYATRVRVTRDILLKVADMTAREGRAWRSEARAADERARRLAGEEVTVDYRIGPESRMIDFRGVAYTREPSPISGALATRYDPAKPQIWRVPLRETVLPKTVVRAPRGGYLVPAAHAGWMGERLALHGIRCETLRAPLSGAPVEAFRATRVSFANGPREGRMTAVLEGEWREERHDLPAGSLYVPIDQPAARLILALLEPLSPDSFVAWGFFNAFFEAKEYMEAYVAEQVAREMLAADPALAAEFEQRLKTDAAFAASPERRLEFFYRRHPSWDSRRDLYPVLRTDAPIANR